MIFSSVVPDMGSAHFSEEFMDDDADADNCQCSTVTKVNIKA